MDFSRQPALRWCVGRSNQFRFVFVHQSAHIRVKVRHSVNTGFRSPLQAHVPLWTSTSTSSRSAARSLFSRTRVKSRWNVAMLPFTTPQTESCIPTLVRISSCLPFRPQYSQHHSTNTTIPNDVRETSSGFSGVIARNEDNTPPAIPQCGSPSQTLGERRRPLPSASVPAIRILCRIFSASNLARNTPEIYSPRVLRGLYLGARERGM